MHSEVGAAFQQSHFQFLDKESFAPRLIQRRFEDLVAARGHASQLNLGLPVYLRESTLDVMRLPQRERTFAGGDDEAFRG